MARYAMHQMKKSAQRMYIVMRNRMFMEIDSMKWQRMKSSDMGIKLAFSGLRGSRRIRKGEVI